MTTQASDLTRQLIELEDTYGAHNYHPLDVVLTKGEGCWVWDVDGTKYLDCLAAYSALNQGHNHPRLVNTLIEQAKKLSLTSRAFRNDQFGYFCQELAELTGFERVLAMNSGAEAVETGIKAARKWGYRVKGVPEDEAEIIVFTENFHGRTVTIVSFSTEELTHDGYGPFTGGFKVVPFGDTDAVENAITPNTVAVLMEPVQGEGGIIIPPEGTLAKLREICTRHNVLMLLDEIQSGLGRTGKMFAYQHEEGVRPDGLILGKALSGGMYPVSAFVADKPVMDVFQPGSHGSTYGGNPLGAAVAREALRVLQEEGLPDRSAHLGRRFKDGLTSLEALSIKELRQIGLWLGIELHPSAGGARRYCEELQLAGMLCKETHQHTIRIAPPLVMSEQEADWAIDKLLTVFSRLG
jgi:ornithine--oxo-acid transaminase